MLQRLVFLLPCLLSALSLQAGLLKNADFEQGPDRPEHWTIWGDGTVKRAKSDKGHALEVGNDGVVAVYQRARAIPGAPYQLSASVRAADGRGAGTLKLEFQNEQEDRIAEVPLRFEAGSDWTRLTFSNTAPEGAAFVTAVLVGEGSQRLQFDNIQLNGPTPMTEIRFDATKLAQRFDGFGAQIWAYGDDPRFPRLTEYRRRVLDELNMRFVRIENSAEWADWDEMAATWKMTQELDIAWLYMIWIGEERFMTPEQHLKDLDGFADWWVEHVRELYAHGIEVPYIELMNEPDSRGEWSTAFTGEQFAELVTKLRKKLDRAGFSQVGIVGPGPAHIKGNTQYMEAMTKQAANSLAAWSTHLWGADIEGPWRSGGPNKAENFIEYFAEPAHKHRDDLPLWVTEYSTHKQEYQGIQRPHGDGYGEWDDTLIFPYYSVSNTNGYAVRTYENTLALLNAGANALFIWQANDEPTEVTPPGYDTTKHKSWGLLDLWGEPKPVYQALKTIYPKIPVGARVIQAPDLKDGVLYASALLAEDQLIVGLSNENTAEQKTTVFIEHAPKGLKILEAEAFESVYFGDHQKGEPDLGRVRYRTIEVKETEPGHYEIPVTLPALSTLTLVLGKE